MMKKLLLLFMVFLCCSCEEDKSVDPTLMPEATMEGKNTFGCLIDGWVYTGERFGKPEAIVSISENTNYIIIRATVNFFTTLEFTLINPVANAECAYTNASFDEKKLEDGKAYITRKDGSIISGTFSGGTMTKGRFDIRYTSGNK